MGLKEFYKKYEAYIKVDLIMYLVMIGMLILLFVFF
jgi:hypothetical protein